MAIRSQPFARALAMRALIASAMALDTMGGRHEALADIGQYRSRGHGRNKPAKAYHARSKYKPHQGVQEKLRRVSGGWAKAPVTKREFLRAEESGNGTTR